MNGLPWRSLIALIYIALTAILGIPITALAGDPARCTTREDRQLKRWVTTCTDGSRAVSRYDAQLQRWRSEITNKGKGEKPRGWAMPGKAPQYQRRSPDDHRIVNRDR